MTCQLVHKVACVLIYTGREQGRMGKRQGAREGLRLGPALETRHGGQFADDEATAEERGRGQRGARKWSLD